MKKTIQMYTKIRGEDAYELNPKLVPIKLARNLRMPPAAVTQKFAFLGRTGSGKTYGATKLAEEMLLIGAQVIALDVVGNWYGLRVPKDKRNAEFDIHIFGGRNADIEINPKAGKIVAGIVVEKNLSAVIDISEFISSEQTRFAYDFLTELFERRKARPAACHVFIEEAQELVPQSLPPSSKGGDNFAARMLHAGERLLKIGRNFGIGASIVTQRPQDVNKKVLNQTEVLFAFQMTGIQERKTIGDWIREKGQDENLAENLPKLETGNALVWSPSWLKISGMFKIDAKITADVSATPEVGVDAVQTTKLQPRDVTELTDSIKALTADIEANTPTALKKRIAELEQELKAKPAAVAGETQTVEAPVLDEKALDELMAAVDAYRLEQEEQFKALVADIKKHETVFASPPTGSLYNALLGLRRAEPKLPLPRSASAVRANTVIAGPKTPAPAPTVSPLRKSDLPLAHVEILEKLSKPQKKLLDVLASFEPLGLESLSRSNLAVFADVSPKSSAFANNLGTLRNTSGTLGADPLIEYLSGGHVKLTDMGRNFADGSSFSANSNEDLLDAWCSKLSGPQGRILRAVFAVHPDSLARTDVAAIVEASPTSSAFANNLGSLRTLGLIDYGPNKTVFATDLLFPFD